MAIGRLASFVMGDGAKFIKLTCVAHMVSVCFFLQKTMWEISDVVFSSPLQSSMVIKVRTRIFILSHQNPSQYQNYSPLTFYANTVWSQDTYLSY